MRILICGDRHWYDSENIRAVLYATMFSHNISPNDTIIIEGEATGADIMGAKAAIELGIPECNILRFPAPWGDIEGKPQHQIGVNSKGKKYWKAAGPFRNLQMLEEGKPDLVLAFHNNLHNSRGTKHMVESALKAGVTVRSICQYPGCLPILPPSHRADTFEERVRKM